MTKFPTWSYITKIVIARQDLNAKFINFVIQTLLWYYHKGLVIRVDAFVIAIPVTIIYFKFCFKS